MKRIQQGTREAKKESLKREYLAFERKMMYVVALAAIQKAREWNEEVTLIVQSELNERAISMQEQLLKVLKAQVEKYDVVFKIRMIQNKKDGELESLNGHWCFDYGEVLTVARRLNRKVNSVAPFVPWEYNGTEIGETMAETEMRVMFRLEP